ETPSRGLQVKVARIVRQSQIDPRKRPVLQNPAVDVLKIKIRHGYVIMPQTDKSSICLSEGAAEGDLAPLMRLVIVIGIGRRLVRIEAADPLGEAVDRLVEE